VRYRCYAKVNLCLEVLGRRADGFHDLATVVHTISLADDLRIVAADDVVTRVEGITAIENNLVTRAAYLLASTTGVRAGAELSLVKNIPVAAGLGGGSSDAAATLVGLNRLWRTGLGTAALSGLAAQLGSDVPLFVHGGAALLRGRGEDVRPLPPLTDQWLVLAVPTFTLANKTASLYAALSPGDFSDGSLSLAAAAQLRAGARLADIQLTNAFTRAAKEMFPRLSEIWADLEERAQRPFHLSGAGPALFGLAASRHEARELARRLAMPNVQTFATRTVATARASISDRSIGYA
jgi:4-diphosphocytidyl-2-C-methyl-D-erythritol kinase